jgi:hypothetical protein
MELRYWVKFEIFIDLKSMIKTVIVKISCKATRSFGFLSMLLIVCTINVYIQVQLVVRQS